MIRTGLQPGLAAVRSKSSRWSGVIFPSPSADLDQAVQFALSMVVIHPRVNDNAGIELGETAWHETAFRTAVASLAKITSQSQRAA